MSHGSIGNQGGFYLIFLEEYDTYRHVSKSGVRAHQDLVFSADALISNWNGLVLFAFQDKLFRFSGLPFRNIRT